jgi:hypothetical protein
VVGAGLGPGRGGGGGDCRGGCLIACEFAGAAPGGRAAAQRGCARGVAGACVRWWVTVRARTPGMHSDIWSRIGRVLRRDRSPRGYVCFVDLTSRGYSGVWGCAG